MNFSMIGYLYEDKRPISSDKNETLHDENNSPVSMVVLRTSLNIIIGKFCDHYLRLKTTTIIQFN